MPDRPDDDATALVGLLARTRDAAPLAVDLATALAWAGDRLADAIVAAEEAGLVEAWDTDPRGPSVALSPLAASRAGLRLERRATVLDGFGGKLRWLPVAVRERPDRLAIPKAEAGHLRGPVADWAAEEIIDRHSPDPALVLAFAELEVPFSLFMRFSRLLHLVGVGTPWNGPILEGHCPICGERPDLGVRTICLACDRAGTEPPVRLEDRPKVARLRDRPKPRQGKDRVGLTG